MFTSAGRRGITLWEVLAVAVILVILLGLLLPALQGARSHSRRASCTNNLKLLGIAFQDYHDTYRAFPGYANVIGGKRASWVVTLLPYLERNDLYQTWQNTPPVTLPLPPSATATRLGGKGSAMNPWPHDRLSLLICPNDKNPVSQSNPLSYAANCGSARTANDFFPSGRPEHQWIEDSNSGIFFNHARADLSLGRAEPNPPAIAFAPTQDVVVTMTIKRVSDGTSKTLALCENLQAGTWVTDPTDNRTPPGPFLSEFQIKQSAGCVWFITGNKDNVLPAPADSPFNPAALGINATRQAPTPIPHARYPVPGSNPPTGGLAYARPSSGHKDGANCLFCDGSVQFLTNEIDYKVYTQLMTSNGPDGIVEMEPAQKTAREAGWTYQFSNSDLHAH